MLVLHASHSLLMLQAPLLRMRQHRAARSALAASHCTPRVPPGAVVLELLPYNWDWKGISEIYVNLTRSLGDVHHLAWRARHPRWALYAQPDEQRYADWTAEECSSRCVAAASCWLCLWVPSGLRQPGDDCSQQQLLCMGTRAIHCVSALEKMQLVFFSLQDDVAPHASRPTISSFNSAFAVCTGSCTSPGNMLFAGGPLLGHHHSLQFAMCQLLQLQPSVRGGCCTGTAWRCTRVQRWWRTRQHCRRC